VLSIPLDWTFDINFGKHNVQASRAWTQAVLMLFVHRIAAYEIVAIYSRLVVLI
jgi:hypothetical protein